MPSNNLDLGEQALSKAVEVGLSTQLDAVESLEVEIRTNPIAFMQGELESADIQAQGLVIKDDLRTDQLTVQTDGVAIDPIKAALGEIEFTRPTNAAMAAKITEADVERAFNSEYIHQKLQAVEVDLGDRSVQVNAQQVQVSLPGQGRVAIAADVLVVELGEQQHVAFNALLAMGPKGYELVLNDIQMAAANTSDELTRGLLAIAANLLDLRHFTLSGMTLQLQHINVQPGHIDMQAQAYLEKFPGG